MKKKYEFMSRFGLEEKATFVPGQKAPWILQSGTDIPAEWDIHEQELTDKDWAKWEGVLKQPETKRIQKVFLKDLERPAQIWHLRFREDANPEASILPVLLPRTERGGSMAFKITMPANKKAKLIFLERPAEESPLYRQQQAGMKPGLPDGELPNITISAELGAYAKLDISYVHPLYGMTKKSEYLKASDMKHCLYYAEADEGARFYWTSVNLGDSLTERGEVHLNAPDAGADVGGAAYVQDGSEQLYQSHIYCHAPFGHCRVHNHGVVEDGGVGTFISVSDISKGAHGTAAREDNRFMTLGDKAKAYADPTLLIDEYDVKASHAATIGRVDDESLFYLQSRGLSEQQAARLMTAGFLTPLFDRISVASLKQQLLAQFYEKLQLEDMLGKAEDDE